MRNLFSVILFGITLFAAPTLAFADGEPWYRVRPIQVTTLRQALAAERTYMRERNPQGHQWGLNHVADAETCAALDSVGLACDYNTRITLSQFLTVNGKGLFPPSRRTNPYCDYASDTDERGQPIDCFIGHGRQNGILRAAVLRNQSLFHDGDLTAADVRARWR